MSTKIAICYYSRHHGNTRKVLDAMAQMGQVDLIDVTARSVVRLEDYDLIGFASGVYYSKFSPVLINFAQQYLPENRKVFFVSTHGAAKFDATREIREAVLAKNACIIGEFDCRGYDTFGPFKLIGGIAKGHPTAEELKHAQDFFVSLLSSAEA